MAIASAKPSPTVDAPSVDPGASHSAGALERLGIRFTNWAERWFPHAFIFVAIAVVIVALGALANGAPAAAVAKSFGDGFWSLIPFTMQMTFVTIGGYVVAVSPPVQALIERLAQIPRSGAGAVGFVAGATMVSSFLSWGLSLIFGGLLVRRWHVAPTYTWTIEPRARPPIWGSAPPGHWVSVPRRRSSRPTRRA